MHKAKEKSWNQKVINPNHHPRVKMANDPFREMISILPKVSMLVTTGLHQQCMGSSRIWIKVLLCKPLAMRHDITYIAKQYRHSRVWAKCSVIYVTWEKSVVRNYFILCIKWFKPALSAYEMAWFLFPCLFMKIAARWRWLSGLLSTFCLYIYYVEGWAEKLDKVISTQPRGESIPCYYLCVSCL